MKTNAFNNATGRRQFIRNVSMGTFGIALLPGPLTTYAHSIFKNNALPRSTPEAQGVSSQGILDFLKGAAEGRNEIHSIMVIRHGHVIAEGHWAPFHKDYKHTLYSLSKSFTSSAIGFAVSEGLLTVDDPVIKFFPDEKPSEVSSNLAAMQVKHLLTMTTGHDTGTMGNLRSSDGNWPKAFLAKEVVHAPGSHFLYNTGATYMLSAIIQTLTGETLMEYLKPRLFDPLGIEGHDWETCPQGINTGGYGLRVRTQDIAHFGQLYLQKGMWNGKQLLPASWIEEATMKQTDSQEGDGDWSQGYGYQFWRCTPGCYRGDGAFGQYCIVIPEKDAVVAMNSDSISMPESMQLVWDYLLPAMKDTETIPADKKVQKLLKKSLETLAIQPPQHHKNVALQESIHGKKITLPTNDLGLASLRLSFSSNKCTVDLEDTHGAHRVVCGINEWIVADNARVEPMSLLAIPGRTSVSTKIAASASWPNEDELSFTWKYVENAHTDTINLKFEENTVTISFLNSVSAGRGQDDPRPDIKGILI